MTDDLTTAGPLGEAGARLRALVARWEDESKTLHRQADFMDGCNGRPFDANARLGLRIKADELSHRAAELDALLSAPVVSPPQGVTPQSDILAWLNIEQRKAERWAFSPRGVYRFAMTGPELMRIRHALGAVASEWQCRFVAEDARCCQLAKNHDGDHRFLSAPVVTQEGE